MTSSYQKITDTSSSLAQRAINQITFSVQNSQQITLHQTPEEGQKVQQPKLSNYYNKYKATHPNRLQKAIDYNLKLIQKYSRFQNSELNYDIDCKWQSDQMIFLLLDKLTWPLRIFQGINRKKKK